MKYDRMKLNHSIKGKYRARNLVNWIFTKPSKILLSFVAILDLPVKLVNLLNLFLAILSAILIVSFPDYIWFAGIILYLSFCMDIVGTAWARYNNKEDIYIKWFDETNGLLRVFIIFLAGAWVTFKSTENPYVLLLFGIAVFSYLMMNYAGALISLIAHQYKIKDNLSDVIKKSLSKSTSWISHSPLGFSFEYQWIIIVLCTLFNKFVLLFWIFIIFSNLKWMQGYFMLRAKK